MGYSIYDYSSSEASSSATGGWNTAEGQDPSTTNDGQRQHKQNVANFLKDQGGVNTTGGSANAQTVTLSQPIATTIPTGFVFTVKLGYTNTSTTVTLNVNSIGAKSVKVFRGGALVDPAVGDLQADNYARFLYDGTYFVLTSVASAGAATTSTSGIVELATRAETNTGTDTTRAVVPANLYFPTGHLWGLTLSNNGSDATNDIDIAVGTARDSTDTINMILTSALTKRTDANWSVGTNAGGLDTGSVGSGTYHVWLIMRSDTGVVDALFSASASAPTMPTNYDYKRRIGSIVRSGGAIKAFIQDGDDFVWKVPVADVFANNPGTSAVTRTLTVPSGIRVKASLSVGGVGTGISGYPGAVLLSDLSITDTTGTASAFTILSSNANGTNELDVGAPVEIWTNTSGQIRSRLQGSNSTTYLAVNTNGWRDPRGRY